MFSRRTLRGPITLGVLMLVSLVALAVGWVLLNVAGIITAPTRAWVYWTLLSTGSVVLVLVIVGTVLYLSLSIKAINLNRRQSNFIDSVTHELKSPIATLKLYLQTLHRHRLSEQEQQGFFADMLEEVERLDELINHLLDAARLEDAPLVTEIDDIELPEVLQECAQGICLRYRVPPETVELKLEPCIVKARRMDLDVIFRNLIDNAVKYGGSPPQVEITLRQDGNRAVVRVADNGQGIPPHLRRKIFGRFERLGLELERAKPGTGLGLYIVRTLASRMGGRVRIRDRDSGPGTVFEVTLPAEPKPVGPEEIHHGDTEAQSRQKEGLPLAE